MACKEAEISEQSYYRWRKEYGGLQVDQARKMKDLERENARLRRLVADLSLVGIGRTEKLPPLTKRRTDPFPKREDAMSGEVSMDAAPMLAVQGETMLRNEEVAAMLRLRDLGWGAKRLAREFGCARNTVRRYLREGARRRSASRSGVRCSTGWRTGSGSSSSGTPGMRT